MANCDSCPSKDGCNKGDSCMVENNPLNQVKNIIAVMSGKGGVGKSTISSLIACELKNRGYRVGLLDADITGPSIPRLFGMTNKSVEITEDGIYPPQSVTGVYVMSMNLLTEYEEQAVVWRGPLIAGAVKQFWTDVVWGDLDYLIVDMPPGTGDVPLTVMQSIPVTGIVMVSTPQNLVSMIVSKAVDMAKKMNVKVLGVIENMSYITCPECNKKIEVFGENAAQRAAEKIGIDLLGELPLDNDLMELSDEGRVELFGKMKEDFKSIVDEIINKINK
ncbi:Chromosome partitioning ATPase, Mrp family, contains Fe-S cluster [Caloramator quimbayensis]|uniref:Iron-sulfur cluster carrier protein n=1 Tax=Caloramator quimbayensis TaxID=1147123 RepID=A0A1T4XNF9_9CLOT|nr:Mrp/NBP35 family ATP-binding protein [Caloramator quimbayensis]SKA90651.1 Chromosome partitioning ATPase, Mrp family, contains Fe-S cluster [Caloramator quimbayensis]